MLARRRGLALDPGDMRFNNSGLDFLGVEAVDHDGVAWILRLPRRPDAWRRAEREGRLLALMQDHLPVALPDWRITTPELIAYPRLPGTPAGTIDPNLGAYVWHIDPHALTPAFTESAGRALAALHGLDLESPDLEPAGPADLRRVMADRIARTVEGFRVDAALQQRWRSWLANDALWPPFTVLIHGDMHPGHMLVERPDHRLTGLLDWTEITRGDPAADLVTWYAAFGEAALAELLTAYRAAGGRSWPGLTDQIKERWAARGVAYAVFAAMTGDPAHRDGAQAMLDAAARD